MPTSGQGSVAFTLPIPALNAGAQGDNTAHFVNQFGIKHTESYSHVQYSIVCRENFIYLPQLSYLRIMFANNTKSRPRKRLISSGFGTSQKKPPQNCTLASPQIWSSMHGIHIIVNFLAFADIDRRLPIGTSATGNTSVASGATAVDGHRVIQAHGFHQHPLEVPARLREVKESSRGWL